METLKIVISEYKLAPTRGTPSAAGLDLYCAESVTILPGGKSIIDTGVKLALPHGTYGRVAGRSGASYTKHFVIAGGVIDSDYRNNIKIIVFNIGKEPIKIEKYSSIAQLIVERIYLPYLEFVEELPETERNYKEVIDIAHTELGYF